MKKIIAVVLAALLLICMAACSGSQPANSEGQTGSEKTTVEKDELLGRSEFDSVVKSNDLTVVAVLATWSTPCEEYVSVLQEFSKNYKNVGVVAIFEDTVDSESYAVDEYAAADAAEIVSENGGKFDVIVPDEYLYTTFCANADYCPTTYVVDNAGNILGEGVLGAQELDALSAMVDALLAD